MRRVHFRISGSTSLLVALLAGASFSSSQPAHADDSIAAAEWNVAKGLQRIVFPDAPSKAASGLVIEKVRIDKSGAVVSAETVSGARALGDVVAPALRKWQYVSFSAGDASVNVEALVSVVYEADEKRFYVQGDRRALFGPPGTEAQVSEIAPESDEAAEVGSVDLGPDEDLAGKKEPPPGVKKGRVLRNPQPEYPHAAHAAGVEGAVHVAAIVNVSGDVVYAAPIDGPAELQVAAVQAARRWKFATTTKDGKPVAVTGSITFNFRLSR